MKLLLGLLAAVAVTIVVALALVAVTALNAVLLAPVSAVLWYTWNHANFGPDVGYMQVWFGTMFVVAVREIIRKGSGIDELFKQLAENRKAKQA